MKNNRSTNSYNSFKQNKVNTGFERYTPKTLGKIAMGITVPSAIIALVSVLIAAFGFTDALLVTFVTFAISFLGSIVIAIDIIVFNYRQSKKVKTSKEPKEMDIMRIVHMLIGIVVGIIIGYLVWGVKR